METEPKKLERLMARHRKTATKQVLQENSSFMLTGAALIHIQSIPAYWFSWGKEDYCLAVSR